MRYGYAIILLAACIRAVSADVYVDQNYGLITPPGDTPGRAVTNAFREYWKAVTNASGGDRVVIAPNSVIPRNDWMKSYPGVAQSDKVLFWADAHNVSGFTNAAGNRLSYGGVYVTNKTNGWDVAGVVDDTLDMSGYSNVAFHGIYFHNQGGGRAIKCNQNSRRFYITNVVAASDQNYALDFNITVVDGFHFAADSCNLINTAGAGSGVNGLSFLWSVNTPTDYDMESVTVNNLLVSFRDYAAGGFNSALGAGVAGGWRSTNDTMWGIKGMVTGGSSTNNLPYVFDSCLIENQSTIMHTGQVLVFRTSFNGPTPGNLVLNDSANGIFTNDMASYMMNFDHGLTVGLGQDGWLRPLRANPAVASGITNGLPVDYYGVSRPNVVSRGAAEPVKLPASGRVR